MNTSVYDNGHFPADLTGQTKFGQSNFLYNCQLILIISTGPLTWLHTLKDML